MYIWFSFSLSDCSEERKVFLDNPWSFVAENVKKDLISAFQSVQSEMGDVKSGITTKPSLVARVGKILFRRLVMLNHLSFCYNCSQDNE